MFWSCAAAHRGVIVGGAYVFAGNGNCRRAEACLLPPDVFDKQVGRRLDLRDLFESLAERVPTSRRES